MGKKKGAYRVQPKVSDERAQPLESMCVYWAIVAILLWPRSARTSA